MSGGLPGIFREPGNCRQPTRGIVTNQSDCHGWNIATFHAPLLRRDNGGDNSCESTRPALAHAFAIAAGGSGPPTRVSAFSGRVQAAAPPHRGLWGSFGWGGAQYVLFHHSATHGANGPAYDRPALLNLSGFQLITTRASTGTRRVGRPSPRTSRGRRRETDEGPSLMTGPHCSPLLLHTATTIARAGTSVAAGWRREDEPARFTSATTP